MRELEWFIERVGQNVLRNGRIFYIANEQTAKYAYSLQEYKFEYGEYRIQSGV